MISNRTKKELIEGLNKNSLNKKLSRISVDRVDKCESQHSDRNKNFKNLNNKSAIENKNRIINNNRRLTKMSNESSTETLTTSENESTKLFSDSKPSFRNYIDEIKEYKIEKSPPIVIKNSNKTTDKRIKERNRKTNSDEIKIKPKEFTSKKKEIVEKYETTLSEQEYSEHDNTVRQRKDVKVIKPSPSTKKFVSIGNIYEHTKNRKHCDVKSQAKLVHKEKNIDLKNLPIAKAYEGSDSLEDLDSSIQTINDNYEYASSTVVKNDCFKRLQKTDKRAEYLQMKNKQATKHSPNDLNYEKKKNYEQKFIKNYQQNPRICLPKKHVDDSTLLASDVESVIEKRKALKTSKKYFLNKKNLTII